MGRAQGKRLLALAAGMAGLLFPVSAPAYTFGPLAGQAGAEQTVFDWSRQACETWDIPDLAARAFRDASGRVQLIASHATTRREIGPSLDNLTHDCKVLMYSHAHPDPSRYDDSEWIAAPYTADGQTIYALVHMEYRGWVHNVCSPTQSGFGGLSKCWYNALTLAVSRDRGDTWSHAAPPAHLVAASPETFAEMNGRGPDGVFSPSNIVSKDGWYYALARMTTTPGGMEITCAMRTNDLSDPKSWRAWDGKAYGMRFINPYTDTSGDPRSAHVCAPISRNEIESQSESLTWSTYFNKWILVGAGAPTDRATGSVVPGVYFSLSDDLIHWTDRRLLMQANVPWLADCGAPNPIREPSILDPASTGRNFETTGRTPYLFFKRMSVTHNSDGSCYWPADRDLVRIPIRFNGSPPTASFIATSNSAAAGESVTFDARNSADSGGPVARYQWDLNGDGIFETDAGGNPLFTATNVPRGGQVGLRVTDGEGLQDIAYGSFPADGQGGGSAGGSTGGSSGSSTTSGNGVSGGGEPGTFPIQVDRRSSAPPLIEDLDLRPRTFSAGRSRPGAFGKRGSKLRFVLSRSATVELRVERAFSGRRLRGRCARATPRRRAARCTGYRRIHGALRREARGGLNVSPFDGRIAGRALAPGAYSLVVVPVDAAGKRGGAVRVTFRIVSAKR
jgi:uncharacterized membrane protein YgcG